MATRTEKLERRRKRKAKRQRQRSSSAPDFIAASGQLDDVEPLNASDAPPDFCFTIADEIDASSEAGFELIEAADGDSKPPGFQMNAYSGGLLDLPNYYYPVVVDLSGMTGPRRATPILRDHQIGQIVGHGRARIGDSSIAIENGRFSGGGDDSREVLEAAREGFPWQASIGARPVEVVYVDKKEKVTANGRTFTGPVYVARKSQLKEVSFVAIGADRGGASATLTAKYKSQGSELMKFSDWLKAKGIDETTLDASTKTALQAAYDAEIKAAGTGGTTATATAPNQDGNVQASANRLPGAGDDGTDGANIQAAGNEGFARGVGNDGASTTPDWLIQRRQIEAGEALRCDRIRAVATQEGVETVKINASGAFDPNGTQEVPFVSHAIQAGWSSTDAELAALRSGRPSDQQSTNRTVGLQNVNADVVEAAMCLTLGIPTDIEQNGKSVPLVAAGLPATQREQVLNKAMEASFQQFGLSALMDEVILASGSHFRGQRGTDAYIKAAMQAERQVINAAASTISLSGILSNVANKLMLSAYQRQETTWRNICAVGSNKDFKVHTRYRLTESGSFRKVGADGELKHIQLSEQSHTTQLDTYGMMIALNRQMMINDDLGAFSELPMFIGQLASTRVEEAVYALLLSNPSSFFHADNNNLTSGAGSALSVGSLTTVKTKFRNQVTSNGKPLLASPQILLVPTTLEDTANRLLESENLLEAATAGSPTGEKNPHKGTLRKVCTPYLNNTAITDESGSAITGQSDTHWYMLTDPAVLAALRVAFLNGRQVPTIESTDAEFETLGMKWRGYMDFGVGAEAPEAAQRAVGA